MGKVYIIGAGPGGVEYFLTLSKKILKRADIIISSRRFFPFIPKGKRRMRLDGGYGKAVEYIRKNVSVENIAVLVSGDPGIFSFAGNITNCLSPCEYEVVPGISSLQLACARLGYAWNDLCIISVHGKRLRGLYERIRRNKRVVIFCDNRNTPSRIALYLKKKKETKAKLTALGNLSLPEEEIVKADVMDLANVERRWRGLWLLLVEK